MGPLIWFSSLGGTTGMSLRRRPSPGVLPVAGSDADGDAAAAASVRASLGDNAEGGSGLVEARLGTINSAIAAAAAPKRTTVRQRHGNRSAGSKSGLSESGERREASLLVSSALDAVLDVAGAPPMCRTADIAESITPMIDTPADAITA